MLLLLTLKSPLVLYSKTYLFRWNLNPVLLWETKDVKVNSFSTHDAFLWSKLGQNHSWRDWSSWTWCILVEKTNRICWARASSFRYLSQRKFTLRQGRSNTIINRWSTQKGRSIWLCLWIKGQAIDLRGDSRKPNFRRAETASSHRKGSSQKSKDSPFWWSYFSSRS